LLAAIKRAKECEGDETMSMMDALRKGFGFLLLSLGVSRPAIKPRPAPKPAPRPDSGKP
jgi:hypothetical protein